MVIGYDYFNVNGSKLAVEIVNTIPNGYNLISKQKGYDIYQKKETIGKEIHCSYYGVKSKNR